MQNNRIEQIILFLKNHAIATVDQLVKVTNSSPATIRRDLIKLSDEGTILRTHGGVSLNQFIAYQPTTEERISTYAASLILPGNSIVLDAGTTTMLIAKKIAHMALRVITTDLRIALLLSEYKQIEVLMTGGRVDNISQSCVGSHGQHLLETVHPDFSFVSCNSWAMKEGVTAPTEEKANLKRILSQNAKQRILVADSSKYGKYSLFGVSPLNRFSTIVTDTNLLAEQKAEMESRDFDLVLV